MLLTRCSDGVELGGGRRLQLDLSHLELEPLYPAEQQLVTAVGRRLRAAALLASAAARPGRASCRLLGGAGGQLAAAVSSWRTLLEAAVTGRLRLAALQTDAEVARQLGNTDRRVWQTDRVSSSGIGRLTRQPLQNYVSSVCF